MSLARGLTTTLSIAFLKGFELAYYGFGCQTKNTGGWILWNDDARCIRDYIGFLPPPPPWCNVSEKYRNCSRLQRPDGPPRFLKKTKGKCIWIHLVWSLHCFLNGLPGIKHTSCLGNAILNAHQQIYICMVVAMQKMLLVFSKHLHFYFMKMYPASNMKSLVWNSEYINSRRRI